LRVISTVGVISGVGVVGRVDVAMGVVPGWVVAAASRVGGRVLVAAEVTAGGGGRVGGSSRLSWMMPQPVRRPMARIRRRRVNFLGVVFICFLVNLETGFLSKTRFQ
jgi:hypothetical protein